MSNLDPCFTLLESTEEESGYIRDEIIKFNLQQTPLSQKEILFNKNYVIKENNKIVAGIISRVYLWNILYIDILFVAESHRKRQLRSYLLIRVEEEAKKSGATLAHLDTFDFKLKNFI